MRRIESQGSYWFLNDEEGWYVRTPKGEGPRAEGPWVQPEPGDPLFDLERHPMLGWMILGEYPSPVVIETLALHTSLHEDLIGRSVARALRYDPDWFPLLCILVSEDGNMASAPLAYER